MVTSDQQLTAATIGEDMSIFEDEISVEIREGIVSSYYKAVEKDRAIVVNGKNAH